MSSNEELIQELQRMRDQMSAFMEQVIVRMELYEKRQTNLDEQQTQLAARVVNLPNQSETSSRSNSTAWKVPSVHPPTFDGKVRHKPAYEAQTIIDNYLHDTKAKAFVYGFRGDNEPSKGTGHITYVQWASLGLTDFAATAWRQLSEEKRKEMTWKDYSNWIREKFISGLTFTQAVNALMSLKQKTSAAVYSQHFNELVSAINHACVWEEAFSPDTLCVMYRNGLKPSLAKESRLFDIAEDLAKLQKETERLDDIDWRISPKHESNDKHRSRHKSEHRSRNERRREDRPFRDQGSSRYNDHRYNGSHDRSNNEVTPMDLDNLERSRLRPLTQEEKDEYDRRGWCKFCRKKTHTFENCDRRKNLRPNRNQAFNVETQSDNDNSGSEDEFETTSRSYYSDDGDSHDDRWSEQGY